MGYRCPNCQKDFGTDEELLLKHFREAGECSVIAEFTLHGIDLITGKKKIKTPKEKKIRKPRQSYRFIDSAHNFRKVNLVSNEDGTDDVECTKCGLKAKRYMMGGLLFDKRISYKRIEKCGGK